MTGMSNVSKLAGEPSGRILVFTLGMKEYGIDILVQEDRGYDGDAHRQYMTLYKRVTNLRGVIVIVDLRVKCEGDVEYDDNTVVIIAESLGQRVVRDSVEQCLTYCH